jgi:hypothetical protein
MTVNSGMHDNPGGILPINLGQTHAGALLNALRRGWNICCSGAYIGQTFCPFGLSIKFLLVHISFSKLTVRSREVRRVE